MSLQLCRSECLQQRGLDPGSPTASHWACEDAQKTPIPSTVPAMGTGTQAWRELPTEGTWALASPQLVPCSLGGHHSKHK